MDAQNGKTACSYLLSLGSHFKMHWEMRCGVHDLSFIVEAV